MVSTALFIRTTVGHQMSFKDNSGIFIKKWWEWVFRWVFI